MKLRIKKMVTIALAATMLLGGTISVQASSTSGFTCDTCGSTLIRQNYLGTCGSYGCSAALFRYTCENQSLHDSAHHVQTAICERGHRHNGV